MKVSNINPYQLIVYYHIANEKNISKAAETLCLTQPTVTAHIKSLEKVLQMKLIEIDRKRVNLTDVGEGLFQYAKEIYAQMISADRFVEHIKNSSLRIGVDDEVKQGKLKILNFPEDIWLTVDAVVHRGYLSSPITQHFISCIKASF